MKDGGKFEKIMKNSEREVELEKVEHTMTLTGSTPITISQANYNYKEELEVYLQNALVLYKNLREGSKNIKRDFFDTSDSIFKIGD